MPTTTLTDKLIRSLRVTEGVIDYRDRGFRGFGVRFTDKGTKSFFFIYPVGGGRRRRLHLGRYPDTKLAEARDKAREARVSIRKGTDPQGEPNAGTFAELADAFLAQYAEPQHSPAWVREERRLLQKELLPVLGSRPPAAITRREVIQLLDGIAERGVTTANRTRAVLFSIFSWSQGRDLIDHNPVSGVPKPGKERSRERVLTTDELKRVWCACNATPSHVALMLQLVLLTAQRGGEVRSMRWADIDEHWWTIPRTKAGRSHRVYLSKQSHAVLAQLDHDTVHVFPSARGNSAHLITPYKAVYRIQEKSKTSEWSVHDLRRTAATTMASIGISPFVIEKILGHSDRRGVTAIYDRSSYDREKQDAMTRWGMHVRQLVK